jgi:hypothetical protein
MKKPAKKTAKKAAKKTVKKSGKKTMKKPAKKTVKIVRKAMYLEEAYHKGVLPKVDAGYILSVISPNMQDPTRIHDPFLIEMISYSGIKAIHPLENGLKFLATGRKIFCMIEPVSYSQSHIEPSLRSSSGTAFMPFRFSECSIFLTRHEKYRILLPNNAQDCYDSFTVDFPAKGDFCVLYFIFDKDVNGKVLPYVEQNFSIILKKGLALEDGDAKKVAKQFIAKVGQYDIWPD